ncbi:hypothetical protein GCM10009422_07060 [Brevundimonas kwangchunensis]|uniref:Holin n=1 Tax=Brevundimonas kwangchunensis TaxID=322163 RepID=A0ABN1GMM7_9CAUL
MFLAVVGLIWCVGSLGVFGIGGRPWRLPELLAKLVGVLALSGLAVGPIAFQDVTGAIALATAMMLGLGLAAVVEGVGIWRRQQSPHRS